MTTYEPAVGRIAYVVNDQDFLLTEIDISLTPVGARASRATVTYRRSALTGQANGQVEALTREWADEQAQRWGTAIAAALKRNGSHE